MAFAPRCRRWAQAGKGWRVAPRPAPAVRLSESAVSGRAHALLVAFACAYGGDLESDRGKRQGQRATAWVAFAPRCRC